MISGFVFRYNFEFYFSCNDNQFYIFFFTESQYYEPLVSDFSRCNFSCYRISVFHINLKKKKQDPQGLLFAGILSLSPSVGDKYKKQKE